MTSTSKRFSRSGETRFAPGGEIFLSKALDQCVGHCSSVLARVDLEEENGVTAHFLGEDLGTIEGLVSTEHYGKHLPETHRIRERPYQALQRPSFVSISRACWFSDPRNPHPRFTYRAHLPGGR